jgi:hypothetical protein
VYALCAAVGLAVGTALTALALASFPLFLGLLLLTSVLGGCLAVVFCDAAEG